MLKSKCIETARGDDIAYPKNKSFFCCCHNVKVTASVD